jgi:hypothetical protein
VNKNKTRKNTVIGALFEEPLPTMHVKLEALDVVSGEACQVIDWTNTAQTTSEACDAYVSTMITFLSEPPTSIRAAAGICSSDEVRDPVKLAQEEALWHRTFGWKGREFKACQKCSFQTYVTGELLFSMFKARMTNENVKASRPHKFQNIHFRKLVPDNCKKIPKNPTSRK